MGRTAKTQTRRAVLATIAGISLGSSGGAGTAAARSNDGNGREQPEVVDWQTEWVEAEGPEDPYEGLPQAVSAVLELAEPVGPVIAEFNLMDGNTKYDDVEIRLTPSGPGEVLSGRSPPIDPWIANRTEAVLVSVECAAGQGPILSPHLVESWDIEGRDIDDEHEEAVVELVVSEAVGALDVTIEFNRIKSWDGPVPGDVTVRVTLDGDGGRRLSGSGGTLPQGFLSHVFQPVIVELSKPGPGRA